MRRAISYFAVFVAGLAALSAVSFAQAVVLDLPRQSQRAQVSQRIGITDITINYHRPLVAGRKVWGNLVPYGQVWRAGANENTVIRFSDPVTIDGKSLDRGVYGLHMIPGENEWTVIFSKNSTSWGAFTYDQAEDALRVTVKPRAAEMHEALTYDFDDVQPYSAVVTLQWEKVAIPFKVGVDVHAAVEANMKRELRGLGQYTWEAWDEGANYLLAEKVDYETALAYSDKSIGVEDRYDNEMTKSRVLVAMNRAGDADAAKRRALDLANPLQLHLYARGLQGEKKNDEAFAIFRENAKKHPEMWFVHSGLARIACSQGKFDEAAKEMKIAYASAPENQKVYVDGLVKRLESKQDIN